MTDSAATNTNEVNVAEVPQETVEFTATEKIYAFFIMVIAFLWVEFQIFNPAGFITTVINLVIIISAIVFLKKNGCKLTAHNKVIAAVLFLFSFVFSITDNGFIKFLAGVFLFGAGAYFVYSAAEGKKEMERYLPVAMMKAIFEIPFTNFGAEVMAGKSAVGHSKAAGNIKHIIYGLIITVPVTFIVASLLMSADKGMEEMLNRIFSNTFSENSFETLLHFMVSIPCGFYLYGMIYGNVKRDSLSCIDSMRCDYHIAEARMIPNMILYTAVTPILLLYVLFFISQANYFLSAFSGSLPEGYTYSEYARRGFFELCAVTVINLFIIVFISFLSKKSGKYKPAALKVYSVSLCVSTIILIVVAISKMVMYISEYGLTRLRFYTMWFMILCGFVFLLIIVKQFRYEMKFAAWFSGIFTVMLGILCFCSPDYVIAKYNIDMYKAGYLDELDADEIYDMSADAVLYGVQSGELDARKAYYVSVYHDDEFIEYLNIPALIIREELGEIELTENEKASYHRLKHFF